MSEKETYIVKTRDYADIVQLSNKEAIEEFLGSPASEIVTTVTGAMASGSMGWLTILLVSCWFILSSSITGTTRDLRKIDNLSENFPRSRLFREPSTIPAVQLKRLHTKSQDS